MSGWACRACGQEFKRERDWQYHEYNCPQNAAKPAGSPADNQQSLGGAASSKDDGPGGGVRGRLDRKDS